MLLVTDTRFAMSYILDKHLQTVHILTPILMPSRPARLGNAIQSAKLLREPGTCKYVTVISQEVFNWSIILL